MVLTNLAPARDSASPWLVHHQAEQPVSLIGTSRRAGQRAGCRWRNCWRASPWCCPPRDTALRAAFDALTARLGVTPAIAAEADDMAMLRLLAREDMGLAVIPPIVVQDELASGFLVEAAGWMGFTRRFLRSPESAAFPIRCCPSCCHSARVKP